MTTTELEALYLKHHGRVPDLRFPKTFTEKIQYRKLFEHDQRFPILSDKIRVKDEIAARLGSDWIIPTLWYGDRLPDRAARTWQCPYVIKASHGSGCNYFVVSPEDADWTAVEPVVERWLSSVYGSSLGEWLYSQIAPRVLVEPYLEIATEYKLYVFGGRVHYIHVVTGGGRAKRDQRRCRCYDRHWTVQPFTYAHYQHPTYDIAAPTSLREMIAAAEALGRDFSFVRVDLYEINEKPLFGEMTFYPSSGFDAFEPQCFDQVFGDLWPGIPFTTSVGDTSVESA